MNAMATQNPLPETLPAVAVLLSTMIIALVVGASAFAADTGNLSTLFWCPERPGNELQIKPGPGCQPLVEEKKDDQKEEKKRAKKTEKSPQMPSIQPDQIEAAVDAYLKDYRNFLACCAAAPDPDRIDELEERASTLIKQTATHLSVASIYMSRNQALIVPIAQARDELRSLQQRYGRIKESKEKLEVLDYEQAGRERRRVREMEESLPREFAPRRGPSRAATGAEIGRSGVTGPSVGATAPTGPSIGIPGATQPGVGLGPRTGTSVGSQPPTLGELVDTPPTIDRDRDNTLTTTNPVRSGTVGPDIGSSSFNDNARTGPALGDSSFNR
jgi:hypothetical protein